MPVHRKMFRLQRKHTAAAGATAAANAVNNDVDLRAAGVFAVQTKADGSEVAFVSLKEFNLGSFQ